MASTKQNGLRRMREIERELGRLATQRAADIYHFGAEYPDAILTSAFLSAHGATAAERMDALNRESDEIASAIRAGDELLPGETYRDTDTSQR